MLAIPASVVQKESHDQLAHDRLMIEVDLQNTQAELTRIQQECAFLAGAVKELVTNSGRISTCSSPWLSWY